MKFTQEQKRAIKSRVAEALSHEPEIKKIVVFGSFVRSDEPNDLDIAVFQESAESYLPLAVKYRLKLQHLSAGLPLDVVPLRPHPVKSRFLEEIEKGEVVYERSSG